MTRRERPRRGAEQPPVTDRAGEHHWESSRPRSRSIPPAVVVVALLAAAVVVGALVGAGMDSGVADPAATPDGRLRIDGDPPDRQGAAAELLESLAREEESEAVDRDSATQQSGGWHGGWEPLPEAPVAGRSRAAAVWTEDCEEGPPACAEMVVWGGVGSGDDFLADGAAYDPDAGVWRGIADAPLDARVTPAVAWTGSEVVVWGGFTREGPAADGAAYDPAADEWRVLPAAPISGRGAPAAFWTGEVVLVVEGGAGPAGMVRAEGPLLPPGVAAYDPSADAWRRLADPPFEGSGPLEGVSAAWVAEGDRLLLWLAEHGDAYGARRVTVPAHDLASGRWDTLAAPDVGRFAPSPPLIPIGERLLAWGGYSTLRRPRNLVYDPAADSWERAPQAPMPLAAHPVAVWTGEQLVVWGTDTPTNAAAYDPGEAEWTALAPAPLAERYAPVAVWTGSRLLVWGGQRGGRPLDDGAALHLATLQPPVRSVDWQWVESRPR